LAGRPSKEGKPKSIKLIFALLVLLLEFLIPIFIVRRSLPARGTKAG